MIEYYKTKYGKIMFEEKNERNDRITITVPINIRNLLETKYGQLIPNYSYSIIADRNIEFYKNGNLRRIKLHSSTEVKTKYGLINATLLEFYDNEEIEELYTQIDYIDDGWTWEAEYSAQKQCTLNLPCGIIKAKIMLMEFYDNTNIKKIEFFPVDTVTINTPAGNAVVRKIIEFYNDNKIKRIEPAQALKVMTSIGKINAYFKYSYPGNSYLSLKFLQNGMIEELVTSDDKIRINNEITYGSTDSGNLYLRFDKNYLYISIGHVNEKKYNLKNCKFEIIN